MKDQYGTEVPEDLVLIPYPKVLDDYGIDHTTTDILSRLGWYELEEYPGFIFVSASEVKDEVLLDIMYPIGDVFNIEVCKYDRPIAYISPCLHRFSVEDGFYHA